MDNLHSCVFCNQDQGLLPCYPTRDIRGNAYQIVYHPACRVYSLHPRPDKETLAIAYDESYYGEHEKKFTFPLVEVLLDYFRDGRARLLARYLESGDAVLDIGCGNGRFLQSLLKKKEIVAHGIELEGKSAQRAATVKGLHLKTGKLVNSDFSRASLKAVCLIHVFEHLDNPSQTIDIFDVMLKPGGLVLISLPNIDSWQSKLFKGHWLHLDPPRHLSFIKPQALKEIMTEKGYVLVKEKHSSLEQNPFGMIQSILNKISAKRDLLFESMKGNKQYVSDYPPWKLKMHQVFFLLCFPLFMITNYLAASCKRGATVEFLFRKATK